MHVKSMEDNPIGRKVSYVVDHFVASIRVLGCDHPPHAFNVLEVGIVEHSSSCWIIHPQPDDFDPEHLSIHPHIHWDTHLTNLVGRHLPHYLESILFGSVEAVRSFPVMSEIEDVDLLPGVQNHTVIEDDGQGMTHRTAQDVDLETRNHSKSVIIYLVRSEDIVDEGKQLETLVSEGMRQGCFQLDHDRSNTFRL